MSFLFGSGKPAATSKSSAGDEPEAKLTSPLYDTGRNVDDITKGLINGFNDSNTTVQSSIHEALISIGEREPLVLLSKALHFLNNSSRSSKTHRVLVMDVMSQVLDEQEQHQTLHLPDDLAQAIATMSTVEIVAEKSISSEWQNSACVLLISLSRLVPDVVAKQLLTRFPTNNPPHYFIVKALADFAHKYPSKFLPHLKEVLTRALPVLATLKHDNLRWVFCAGLGRWAKAIMVCMEDGSTTIPRSEFSASMHTALKHVLGEWIASRESKVRLAAVEALGYMSQIIETEHLVNLFGTLFQTMQTLLKKEARDQHPVTIGFQNLLSVATRDCAEVLAEHMDTILLMVHSYLSAAIKLEGTYSKAEKNQRDLIKIYEVMGTKFIDNIMAFLQKHLESKDIAIKISTLRALTHLVSTRDTELAAYRDIMVSATGLLAQETDRLIHSELADLIDQMAAFGYLSSPGGTDLVATIIRGCAIPDEAVDAPQKGRVTAGDLRSQCDEILGRMTASDYAEDLDYVLWPFLLESFTPGNLTPAFAVLCKAISDIAKRISQEDEFIVDFDKTVNVPKPNFIFSRLLIMLSQPYGRNSPGVNILRALYCLSPNIHPDVVEPWSKKLGVLKKYIDQPDSFNQDQWENLLLSMVRESIDAVDDDDWTVQIGEALLSHVSLYQGNYTQKKTILSVIGLVAQKCHLREYVTKAVYGVFDGTNHSSDVERLGCARGLGQIAATHTDPVLTKLQMTMKGSEKKKGFGFFGSSKGESESGAKATALLAYGYVCMLTPTDLLTSRIEVHVVSNLLPILRTAKTQDVKSNGLKAIDLIGKAIHPSRVPDFTFKSRDDLIKAILEVMSVNSKAKPEAGVDYGKLRVLGLESISTLLKLPPNINLEMEQIILSGTLPLYSIKAHDPETDDLMIENLNEMLSSMLRADPTQGTLDDILQAQEPYVASANLLDRVRASNSYVRVLKEFARLISEDESVANGNENLRFCGRIVGKMIPRITEVSSDVRISSLNSIYFALRIHYYLKKGKDADEPAIQRLGPLRNKLATTDPDELFSISKELSSILCESIDSEHLATFLDTLLTVLEDIDLDGARGSCVVLNGLIRLRGKELERETPKYVKEMINNMVKLSIREQVVNGLLHGIRGLARHHALKTINSLLDQPVPHSKEVIKAMQVLSTDRKLIVILFDHLIDIMNNSQLFEERKKNEFIATHIPMSATWALSEVLEMVEINAIATEYYARLMITILLRVGSANAITANPPVDAARGCLKNFLLCVGDDSIIEQAEEEGSWRQLVERKEYGEGIQNILHLVCQSNPHLVKEMFEIVKQFSIRTFDGTRVAATSMISVLISHVKNDREMVHDAINTLLSRSGTDEIVSVKTFALRGFKNMSKHPKEILHKYLTPVIGALLSCIEDEDESIILETMISIREIFTIADDEYVSPLLVNLCVRLKPSFEKANPEIRASAIRLFGALARFCKGSQRDALLHNIHNLMPSLLVHLCDDVPDVANASKEALRLLVPELGSESATELFQEDPSFDNDAELDYDEFAENFAEMFIVEFPNHISDLVMNLNVYFKHEEWFGLVKSSCLLTGYVLSKIDEDQRKRVNLRHTCSGLVSLLKRSNANIREKASKMLGLLFEC